MIRTEQAWISVSGKSVLGSTSFGVFSAICKCVASRDGLRYFLDLQDTSDASHPRLLPTFAVTCCATTSCKSPPGSQPVSWSELGQWTLRPAGGLRLSLSAYVTCSRLGLCDEQSLTPLYEIVLTGIAQGRPVHVDLSLNFPLPNPVFYLQGLHIR